MLERSNLFESHWSNQWLALRVIQNLRLKLYVVGHTDNVGGLAMNMHLSRRRADRRCGSEDQVRRRSRPAPTVRGWPLSSGAVKQDGRRSC